MYTYLVPTILLTITIRTHHSLRPPPLPPRPPYATEQWIHYAASIVAGETVPDCTICHLWIACTIDRDVERGYPPWELHPDRWRGYRTPLPEHLTAIEAALSHQGCLSVPTCAYLGNLDDYRLWASGLAEHVPSHIVGNRHGAIVCIPPTDPSADLRTSPATPSPEASSGPTATPRPPRPPSPPPARRRRSNPTCE